MDGPAVRVFVQGENAYHTATDWPPPEATPTTFFLSGAHSTAVKSLNDGALVETAPEDILASTSWTYPDPQWMAGVTTFDESGIPDHVARVTTFTTAPFDREREFTGQGVLVLHASSDQTDMDVVVKLSLLPQDAGQQGIKVSQGWLRASHRAEDDALTTDMRPFHSHQAVEEITPGEIYPLRIELIPMSFLVRPGERIRLEISNWDSLIADAPMTHFYGQKVGTDTYHHDVANPSQLHLHERPRNPSNSGE